MRKYFVFLLVFTFNISTFANPLNQASHFKHEEERLKALEEQKQTSNIFFDTPIEQSQSLLPKEEQCFNIKEIVLVGDESDKFKSHLKKALKKLNFKENSCIGEQGIGMIYNAISNEIIADGYITTSLLIPPQNIKEGSLKLEVVVGKIDNITINDTNSTKNRASIFTSFGGYQTGKTLNLRNIEQALETLQNASNGDVSVALSPSDKENYSDINITKEEKLPLALSLSFDNLGSKATGRYQGGLNLYALNLMGFNEIFYTTYSKNIFKADKESVEAESKRGKSDNIYYGITVPYGRFSLDFNEYRYEYDQAIPGAFGVYKYSGKSKRRHLTLNYLYHRDQSSKNSIFFRLWEKENKNYIEEYELDNQRRKTAGYEVGLNSQFFIENGYIAMGVAYKKGTGARGSLRAPEEEYGEGTTRVETISLDFNFRKSSSKKPLTYDLKFSGMWNNTPLTLQERFNIGGYYTVRGFDGEMSLVGDRGYYIRNTLEYHVFNTHTLYMAFDIGRVSGQSSKYLSGNTLVGTGVGLKGNIKKELYYDFFVGFPLSKPEFFETDDAVLNFNFTYNF